MLNRRTALSLGAALALVGPRPSQAQTGAAWRALTPMPMPAQEIYPTLWNGEIIVAGGFSVRDDEPAPTAGSFLYSLENDAWRAGPDLPEPRHHPQLAVVAGRLYAIAGFAAESAERSWVMQASGWMRDGLDGEWEPAPALPAPRGEAVLLVHEGRLHLMTGRSPTGGSNTTWRDHGDVADHVVLDPSTGRWESARPAPTARNSAAGVALDGRLYVVGGRRVNDGSNAELEVYDPATDRWDSLRPMPQAQGGLAAGVLDGRIVAFGGEYFDGDGGVHPETWVYDPETDQWTAGPDMMTPRHGLGGVSVNDAIYAVGGATGVAADGTSGVLEVLAVGGG